jgi:hypothetical protein
MDYGQKYGLTPIIGCFVFTPAVYHNHSVCAQPAGRFSVAQSAVFGYGWVATSNYVKRSEKFSVAPATVSSENREFEGENRPKHAPHRARLGVLLSKALRGAADEGALSSRLFVPLLPVAPEWKDTNKTEK